MKKKKERRNGMNEITLEKYVESLHITIEKYVENLSTFSRAMTAPEVAYPDRYEVLESAMNLFLFAFVFCASEFNGIEQVTLYNAIFSNLHHQAIELLKNYNEFRDKQNN
jgi:hypothetical protein